MLLVPRGEGAPRGVWNRDPNLAPAYAVDATFEGLKIS